MPLINAYRYTLCAFQKEWPTAYQLTRILELSWWNREQSSLQIYRKHLYLSSQETFQYLDIGNKIPRSVSFPSVLRLKEASVILSCIQVCQLCFRISLFIPMFWVSTAKKILQLVQLTVLWHCTGDWSRLEHFSEWRWVSMQGQKFIFRRVVISFYPMGRKLLYHRRIEGTMKITLKNSV